jgi:hypothetical protein
VLDLRNKHVAHSVNSFEENEVAVHIEDRFVSPEEIETVTAHNSVTVGVAIGQPVQLRRLANWWLEHIDKEIALERKAVLQVARATPLAEIKAYGKPRTD